MMKERDAFLPNDGPSLEDRLNRLYDVGYQPISVVALRPGLIMATVVGFGLEEAEERLLDVDPEDLEEPEVLDSPSEQSEQ